MEVDVKIVSDNECQQAFDNDPATSGKYYVTNGMICAGGIQGKDSCGVKYLFIYVFSLMKTLIIG